MDGAVPLISAKYSPVLSCNDYLYQITPHPLSAVCDPCIKLSEQCCANVIDLLC
jgi:hypothetical protein